jgi:hypothetical protein
MSTCNGCKTSYKGCVSAIQGAFQLTTPAIKPVKARINRNTYPIQHTPIATQVSLGIFFPAMPALVDGTIFSEFI